MVALKPNVTQDGPVSTEKRGAGNVLTDSMLSGFDSETQLLVGVLRGLALLSHCAFATSKGSSQ